MSPSDPLEGLERRSQASQIGIIASVVRQQANAITDLERQLRANTRALWGLLAGVVLAGVGVIFALLLTRPPV